MKQRIRQGDLQRLKVALSAMINLIVKENSACDLQGGAKIRRRKFNGLSGFVKALMALPADTDYRPYETVLKRRLIVVRHRLVGHKGGQGLYGVFHAVDEKLQVLLKLDTVIGDMLRKLSDVDISEFQPPMRHVSDIKYWVEQSTQ